MIVLPPNTEGLISRFMRDIETDTFTDIDLPIWKIVLGGLVLMIAFFLIFFAILGLGYLLI